MKFGVPNISRRANCMVAVIAIALTFLFKHRNKLADQGKLIINGSPEFRYTI